MVSLYIVPLVAQVLVPVVLLVWHGLRRTRNGATAVVRTLLIASYLVAIALAGLWLAVPWFLALVYLVILAVQTRFFGQTVRVAAWWPSARREWMGFAVSAALAVGSVALAVHTITGRWPADEEVIDLEFPLRDGTYVVANGGSNDLISAHVQTLTAERFRDYRGQSYGIDIVALNAVGTHASGVAPRDPRRYVIFGDPIHAPCSGVVLRAQDGHLDMSPPEPDRDYLPGNFVFLECAGVHVLLGHMQRGTVRVRPGDRVTSGDVLGNVGNSGNTNEPHLHIHAQRPAASEAYLSGDPLPIRLDGRFLVRNDRVESMRRTDTTDGNDAVEK